MFASFETGQCQVNGIRIHYRKGGSGQALLLLHGHPQTHAMWHKVAEPLARHFTVVAADLRGYGDSANGSAYATAMIFSLCELICAGGECRGASALGSSLTSMSSK